MNGHRLKASLSWALALTTVILFGTYLTALVTNTSTSIPGVIDVEVVDSASESSVSLAVGPGILALATVLTVLALVLHAACAGTAERR